MDIQALIVKIVNYINYFLLEIPANHKLKFILKGPCSTNTCQNNGACSNTLSAPYYSCYCLNGYTGSNCQNSNF